MWTVPLLGLETVSRPRVGVAQIRQLARLCTILRWPGLLFGAIAGIVVPPPATILLVLLIVWVAVYNSWGITTIPRASDGSILRIGRGLTLLDCVSYFWLLAIFPVVPPAVYAAFILLIVCLVAYDGAEGAMLSLAIFVIGMIALQAVRVSFYHQAFNGPDVLLWSLIIAFAAAAIAAFDRILVGSLNPPASSADAVPASAPGGNGDALAGVGSGDRLAPAGNGDHAVHLSPREQEVLRLVSEGYSNGMIANRLHLSENTVKTYVENLLTRLHARNRAEAVAAASRQNLL